MVCASPEPEEPPPLDPWCLLLKQAEVFAACLVSFRRWRHAPGGVLPDGYDPSAIAAQAFEDLWKTRKPDPNHVPDEIELQELASALKRRVRQHVDRLHHRKENFVVCNEQDLAPYLTDDDELVNFIETLPDSGATPLQILIRKEDEAEVRQFQAFLGKERRLQRLFQCLCDGISKPNALAQKLKLRVGAVNTLRQRLQRRLTDFFSRKTSAEIGVQRKKV